MKANWNDVLIQGSSDLIVITVNHVRIALK